jgi:hypothetical protein
VSVVLEGLSEEEFEAPEKRAWFREGVATAIVDPAVTAGDVVIVSVSSSAGSSGRRLSNGHRMLQRALPSLPSTIQERSIQERSLLSASLRVDYTVTAPNLSAADDIKATMSTASFAPALLEEVVTAGWVEFATLVTSLAVSSVAEPVLATAAVKSTILVGEGEDDGPLLTLSWRLAGGLSSSDNAAIRFTLELDPRDTTAPAKWLGLGFGTEPKMVGSDAFVCSNDGPSSPVVFYRMAGKERAGVVQEACSQMQLGATQYADGVSTTSFSYALDDGESAGCLGTKLPCALSGAGVVACDTTAVLWAWGNPVDWASNGYHERRGSALVNFATGEATEAGMPRGKYIVHAVLMTIGWGLLLPIGVLVARFGKEGRTSAGGGGGTRRDNADAAGAAPAVAAAGAPAMWYRAHRTVQVAGLSMGIIGFIVALQMVGDADSGHFSRGHAAHKQVGLLVTLLGIAQPLFAIFRPHPPAPSPKSGGEQKVKSRARLLWERAHKGTGYVAVVLAVLLILSGFAALETVHPGIGVKPFRGLYVAVLAIVVSMFAGLTARGQTKSTVMVTAVVPVEDGTAEAEGGGRVEAIDTAQ